GVVSLTKCVEDMRQKVVGNTDAGVADADLCAGGVALHSCVYSPSLGSELDRIGQQIPHHLLQAARVTGNHAVRFVELRPDLYRLGLRVGPHGINGSVDDPAKLHSPNSEANLTGNTPGYIQKIVNKLRLHSGIALDAFKRALGAGSAQRFATQ